MDLDLRVFAETFAEPVLRMLLQLERRYETDMTVLTLAQEQAGIAPMYGQDPQIDELLEQELLVRVNVGIGSTNPQQKIERFGAAMEMMGKTFGPVHVQRLNFAEVAAETFGILGYEDGSRFYNDEDDPQYAALTAQLKELQQAVEGKQMELQAEAQRSKEDNRTKLEAERLRGLGRLVEQMLSFEGELQMERVKQAGATAQTVLGGEQRMAEQAAGAEARRVEQNDRARQAQGLEMLRQTSGVAGQGGA